MTIINDIKNDKSNQSTIVTDASNLLAKKVNNQDKKSNIRNQSSMFIILKAYDNSILDHAVKSIINLIQQERLYYKGPIPLPSKRIRTTILTSPHIDKHAMNQFEQVISKRVIIVEANQSFINSILNKNLSSGVDVKIKIKSITTKGDGK